MYKRIIGGLTAVLVAVGLAGFGMPAQAVGEKIFTVTNKVTGQPLTTLSGTPGVAINEEYLIEFVGTWDWTGGRSESGYWLSTNGITRSLTFEDLGNGSAVYHLSFTGTPTASDIRYQSISIGDSLGESFEYGFTKDISGTGPTRVDYDPISGQIRDVILPNAHNVIFGANGLPRLSIIHPTTGATIPLTPGTGLTDSYKTQEEGVFTLNYTTGELYDNAGVGGYYDARADVSIRVSDSKYEWNVRVWSMWNEGGAVPHDVLFEGQLESGNPTDYAAVGSTISTLGKLGNSPFLVFTNSKAAIPTSDGAGIVSIFTSANADEFVSFTMEYYDYEGCPAFQELDDAWMAGTLTTVGFVSSTPCQTPVTNYDLTDKELRFDLANETLNGVSASRDQRTASDDIANGVAVGDTVDYQDVVSVNGVTLNALLTLTAAVGQYNVTPGNGLVEEIDDWIGTGIDPRIRTNLEHEAGESDRFAEYTLVFYVNGDANKTPVTVSNAILNVYDIDFNQYVEVNNMESYVFAQEGALAAQDKGAGIFRFVDVQGISSNSGDESRVVVNFADASSFMIRLGMSSLNVNADGASYALDFSIGTAWTMATAVPETQPQDPTVPVTPTVPVFSTDPLKSWYSLSWGSTPTLFQVNKTTGELTVIGTATENIGGNFASMEVDATNGIAYALVYGNNVSSDLWSINLSTGVFTKLHTFDQLSDVTAMTLTPDGKLWFAADTYQETELSTSTAIYGSINLSTYAITIQWENMSGERIAALVSDESGNIYGIAYSGQMYSYDVGENSWTLSLNLARAILAADYENGFVLAQGWDGDVVAIEVATLTVTELWKMYTLPQGLIWDGGEAFSVGGLAPVTVVANEPVQNNPTPTPTQDPTPVSPTVPTINPIVTPAVSDDRKEAGFIVGDEVKVSGQGLGNLNKILVDNKEVAFTGNTEIGFSFALPELAPGVYDLVVVGPYGTVTYSGAIKVAAKSIVIALPETLKASKSFSGFTPGSSVLTAKMKAELKAWFSKYKKVSMVNIAGFTMGPTVLASDERLALRRATVVKAYLKSLNSKVKFSKLVWKNEKKLGTTVRRAEVSLTYSK